MGSLLSQRVGQQSPPAGVELPPSPRHDLFHNGLPSPSTSATRSLYADEEVKSVPLETAGSEAGPEGLPTPELGDQAANLSLALPLPPSNKPPPPSSTSPLQHPPPTKTKSHQMVSRPSTPDSSKATFRGSNRPKSQRKPTPGSSATLPPSLNTTTTKMPPSKAYHKQPIAIPIHIVPPSERHNLPYTTTAASVDNPPSADAFTLYLVPRTRIKELCVQAAAYLRLQAAAAAASAPSSSSPSSPHPSNSHPDAAAEEEHDKNEDADADADTTATNNNNTVTPSSITDRFEARDRDGHAFDADDTVSEALLAGEPVFLLERRGGGGGGGEVEGVLRGLRAEAARRGATPSVLSSASSPARSRSSSVAAAGSRSRSRSGSVASKRGGARVASASRSRSRSRARSEQPRKTPSQRALEIATRGASLAGTTAGLETSSRGRALFVGGARGRGSGSISVGSGGRRASSSSQQQQQQGDEASAEIVDTIEESPSPAPLKSRKHRASVHASAKKDDGADDLLPPLQQKQKKVDEAPERLTRAIENPPPTARTEAPDAAAASQQSQQSLPSPASSPSLAPQKLNPQLSIPNSQDSPTPPPAPPSSAAQQSRANPTAVQSSSGDEKNATMADKLQRDIISLSPELGNDEPRARPANKTAQTTHTHTTPNDAPKTTTPQQPAPAAPKPSSSMRPSSSAFLRDMLPREDRPPPRPRPPNATATAAAGKPDPYDMIVLDDDVESPRLSSVMRSSVRRLGSGSGSRRAPSAGSRPAPSSVARNSLLLVAKKPPPPPTSSARALTTRTAEDDAVVIPSTPPRREQTPQRTPAVHQPGPSSSPTAPLPSSPTDLVAAVLSRDGGGRPRPPRPHNREYVVIEESDLEAEEAHADADADESILNDARDRFSSSQQHTRRAAAQQSTVVDEAALPWAAPPLRLGGVGVGVGVGEDDAFWPVRAVGRRASVFGGEGARRTAEERDERADIRKLGGLGDKRTTAAAAAGTVGETATNISSPKDVPSGLSEGIVEKETKGTLRAVPGDAWVRSTPGGSGLESRLEDGPRSRPPNDDDVQLNTPKRVAGRKVDDHATSASHMTPSKSPLVLIHGSSSSAEGAEEIGWIEGEQHLPAPKDVDSSPPKKPVVDGSKTRFDDHGEGRDSTQNEDHGKDGDSMEIAGCLGPEMAAFEPPSDSADDVNPDLPILDDPAIINPASDKVEVQSQAKHSPPVAHPTTDPIIEPTDEEPPTSAQASKRMNLQTVEAPVPANAQKRKREPSEELDPDADPEDDRRRRKRIRREERHAKRAEKKRLRAAEEAQREADRVHLEDERKRLASWHAHRRAKELEIIVSSPLKAAAMGLVLSETDDSDSHHEEEADAAVGEEAPGEKLQDQLIVPPSRLERGDNSDSLSSREDNGRVSWRALSKRHFAASSEAAADGAPSLPVATSTEQRLSPEETPSEEHVVKMEEMEPEEVGPRQLQRTHFDEWAFFETTLGRDGYSPLDIHNRIHLSMVSASIRGMGRPAEEPAGQTVVTGFVKEEPTEEPTEIKLEKGMDNERENKKRQGKKGGDKKREDKKREDKKREDKKRARRKTESPPPSHTPPSAHTEAEEEANPDTTPRSIRSAAPSPKNMAVAPAQKANKIHATSQAQLERQAEGGTSAARNRRRKKNDAARKKRFRAKKKGRSEEDNFWRALQEQRSNKGRK